MKSQSIKSPEGVRLLMENIWLRHQAGMKQRSYNVFMVELPPLTEEEKAELLKKEEDENGYTQDELFGAWI